MQLQLNPNTRKKEHPKLLENHKAHENKQLNKKTERWKLDVLYRMSITRAVSHFEMSALNAASCSNAVGVHVNAVAVEPEHKKKNPKLSENHKAHGTSTKQEGKEVEVLNVLFSMLVNRDTS